MCWSLKCHSETAEITVLNTVDLTRRVKSITRNTPRYSHGSLGHCESSIKEGETETCIHLPHVERRPQMRLKRADEQLLVIRGLTRSARAGRGQARDEKLNLDSVKAVLSRIQDLKSDYSNRHIN